MDTNQLRPAEALQLRDLRAALLTANLRVPDMNFAVLVTCGREQYSVVTVERSTLGKLELREVSGGLTAQAAIDCLRRA